MQWSRSRRQAFVACWFKLFLIIPIDRYRFLPLGLREGFGTNLAHSSSSLLGVKVAPPASARSARNGSSGVHMSGYGRCGRRRASSVAHTLTSLTLRLHIISGFNASTSLYRWVAEPSTFEDKRRDTARMSLALSVRRERSRAQHSLPCDLTLRVPRLTPPSSAPAAAVCGATTPDRYGYRRSFKRDTHLPRAGRRLRRAKLFRNYPWNYLYHKVVRLIKALNPGRRTRRDELACLSTVLER